MLVCKLPSPFTQVKKGLKSTGVEAGKQNKWQMCKDSNH